MAAFLRRFFFPLSLVGIRLRTRLGRLALLGAGVAAGAAVLGLVVGGSVVAQDRSLARALDRVPPESRTVQVAHFGIPGADESVASLDQAARRVLADLSDAEPISVVAYKLVRIEGSPVQIAGIDGIERWVRLRSGRFPSTCTPARCEVIRIGGGGRVASTEGIRLVAVGSGMLVSPLPFARFAEGREALVGENPHRDDSVPFVLANGTDQVGALPALAAIYRSYGWIVPLAPDALRPWTVDPFLAALERARSTLQARSGQFEVTAPASELGAASEASDVAGRRLLLIGGQAAALLVAFAVLAGVTMRRDVEAAWRRLTWFGGRRWQLLLLSASEVGAIALVGTVIGWAVALAATAVLAHLADAPAGPTVAHSLLAPSGIATAAGLACATTVVLLLALSAPTVRIGGLRVSSADIAALGALAVIAVTLARGELDARALASEGATGTMLLLLPGLATFVAGVAVARLFAPALRGLERVGRRAGTAVRIAALSLARAPGRAVVAVTFLVVSVALGLFALVYRATLADGLSDHVAYRFPANFLVSEDFSAGALVPPLEAASLSRYEALPGADVVPVLRRQGSVGELSGSRRFTLLSLPAEDAGRLDGWRGDFSQVPLASLAGRIAPRGDVDLRGVAVPGDAAEIRVPVAVQRGDPVTIHADVATIAGGFAELPLGTLAGPGVLTARVPRALRGGTLLGLTFGRPLEVEGHAQGNVPELTGVARFRPLRIRGTGGAARVADYRDWTRTGALNAEADAGSGRLTYVVTNASATRFRVRQPTDGEPVPVVASPRLAAVADSDGLLSLRLAAGELTAKVVGTAARFPTTSGDFVVADERVVTTTMNAEEPGAALPNEVWISARSDAALARLGDALAGPPFDVLDVRSRAVYERALESEPLVRGTLLTLGAAAVVALALSVVGLVLLLVSELRDERGELFDLEAQGAAPATLRRHLRLRALLVLAAGLVGGLAAGIVLSAVVTDLVTLTADATAAEPPLVLRVDWPLVSLALALYAALAAALVVAVTRAAFRSRLPEQAAVVA